jgi:mycothiol synthase
VIVGFDRRPLTPGDVTEWTALVTAIQDADRDVEYSSEQDLREQFDDPTRDFASGSVAIYHGPAMVGYGVLDCRSVADPVHHMMHGGGVHPSYRGRGLGGELLGWAEEAAVPLHNRRFPGRPLSLSSGCLSGNAAAVALHEQRGYQPARWFHSMLRDLSAAIPEPVIPPGVRITGYEPGMAEHARLVRNESFRDHWGSTETSPERWAHLLARAAFRPGLSFLAYEKSEPLGMLLTREHETQDGLRDLHVALVGTRAAARKRGIATALLLTSLSAARYEGYDRASLDVDSDSLTGAVRLYEHVGFTVARTWIAYRKQLTRPGFQAADGPPV